MRSLQTQGRSASSISTPLWIEIMSSTFSPHPLSTEISCNLPTYPPIPFSRVLRRFKMASEPATLKPAQTAQRLVEYAVRKHNDRYETCFLKAFAAGVMLSFGNILLQIVSGGSTSLNESNPGIVKILGASVFPFGLIMITLLHQELLTSNMLASDTIWTTVSSRCLPARQYFSMAVLKRAVPFWGLCLNWFIVFFGNLAGSLFVAAILVRYSGILSDPPYHDNVQAFVIRKAADPQWHQIFLRGIGCNWLVSIAMWQAAAANDTLSKVGLALFSRLISSYKDMPIVPQIVAVWLPIMTFVACSFDHVVANMFSIPLGIMFGADITPAEYIRKSLFAAFFGNIIGALFFGMPATYVYLSDYGAGGYKNAENGEASGSRGSSDTEVKHDGLLKA
ncbi:hypothetical protein D9756_005375 [Leucocoprinus leucothites]|uniref:Formate/nitrite transporter n=1 Tax=Leucocoprinus leucothites TaxID=201217 RepID=A0A8H5D8H3_9AGAR|nr:hypothetical protein D9756_005375 [Leucoagaricus leucothites]